MGSAAGAAYIFTPIPKMLTYEKCVYALGKRETKKLANNTYLRKVEEHFVVRLHSTDIIKVFAGDRIELNSGGWQSSTTKARFNEFTNARISQKRGIWYMGKNEIPFYDGIVIDASGNPIDAIDLTGDIVARKKLLDKKVKQYIDGYIKWAIDNGVESSSGDCWCCLMQIGGSLDHVWSHIEEGYYFGSFLKTAVLGSNRTLFWVALIQSELKRGDTFSLRDVLVSYFRRVKPQLMDYVELEEAVV